MGRYVVTGGQGFIGSHLVDALVDQGHDVLVVDNGLSGTNVREHSRVAYQNVDIRNLGTLKSLFTEFAPDGVFHMAAIPRTPWCIDDPVLAYETNVLGTLHVLEAAKHLPVRPRVVLCSSNVVYAYLTPYRTSKEAVEGLQATYAAMYGMSVCALRFSNVYGTRQSEDGPSPNVFAALRKAYRENGVLCVTGDGEQTRNYTHVSDIVRGNVLAMESTFTGVLDLCTGVPVALNTIAAMFKCPVVYVPDRPGDVKHILQDPAPAREVLGWTATVSVHDAIQDIIVPRRRTTVLTNIFNEEYLLPAWLEHHRRVFDHGIVVDYGSTDRSLDIVREMCPTWEIRKTRNEFFDAIPIDAEFEDIERSIDGIKVVLNTTEFLIAERALASYFPTNPQSQEALAVTTWSTWAEKGKPDGELTLQTLFAGIEKGSPTERSARFIHTFPSACYTPGRHTIRRPSTPEAGLTILWFGFYPWTDRLLQRKLQIKTRIGKDAGTGFGFQHWWTEQALQAEYESRGRASVPYPDRLRAAMNRASNMRT